MHINRELRALRLHHAEYRRGKEQAKNFTGERRAHLEKLLDKKLEWLGGWAAEVYNEHYAPYGKASKKLKKAT